MSDDSVEDRIVDDKLYVSANKLLRDSWRLAKKINDSGFKHKMDDLKLPAHTTCPIYCKS